MSRSRRAGGLTIGLLPGWIAPTHPFVAVALTTGLGEMRNALLVRCADAVIGIGGSAGTLSEIALARRTGVPVVWMLGWEIAPLGVETAATPAVAVEWALEACGARR